MDGTLIVGVGSIMHTGTHLLWRMLEPMKGINPDAYHHQPGAYKYLYHLVDSSQGYFGLEYPILTPMRHPVRVLESFRRRNKPFSMFAEQWRNLERIHGHTNYIHVDRKDRDWHVNLASRAIGFHVKPSWPLLSAKNTLNIQVTDERVEEIPRWIMDLYRETLLQ